MKKIVLICFSILLIFSVASCNDDRLEGNEVVDVNAVKIDSVKIANYTMDVMTIQSIQTYSNYNKNCEGFYGYDYLYSGSFERQVISYKFKTDANCEESVTKVSQINFRPQKIGTYVFKFYKGKDDSGKNLYIEENIVVK